MITDARGGMGRRARSVRRLGKQHSGLTSGGYVMSFGVLRTAAGLLFLGTFVLTANIGKAYADQPTGWGGGGNGYELSRDDAEKHAGKASGCVRSTGDEAEGFGTLTQGFRADGYRGKRVRMSAYVKTDGVERQAGLWMRIDGKEKTGLAFDNMMTRPVKGTTDWKKYDVVLDVPDDAGEIYFGFLVAGKGRGWVDDITLEVVDKDVPTTGLDVQPTDRQGELTKDLPKEAKNLDFEQ
jgi:hypothetical protein